MISCKDYLRTSNITSTNLTIIDRIETPKLTLGFGKNLFFTSQWNLSKPFLIKKGYVPLLKRFSNSYIMIANKNDSILPDYYCLNSIRNNESSLFKLSTINYLNTDNKTYNNILINFEFNNPNQTILTNYSQSYVYKLFGSFAINAYTSYGGNLLTEPRRFINVQRIKTYPFGNIQINKFELGCTLNMSRLDCILLVNISNYANSYQQLTIDYGDGSFGSFRINPYCK